MFVTVRQLTESCVDAFQKQIIHGKVVKIIELFKDRTKMNEGR